MRDLILIRCRSVEDHNLAFADQLRLVSNCEVNLLVDDRHANIRTPRDDVISLTNADLTDLRLHIPHDVGWRCGDYGLYVAWKAKPDYHFYWIMDDDLRIGGDAQLFFAECVKYQEDLLAVDLELAPRHAYWWPHTVANNVSGYLCKFPILRLSFKSVATCYAKRLQQTSDWNRRALWPNDEALVATTIINAGQSFADFKQVIPHVYYPPLFSVGGKEVDAVPTDGPPCLIHPYRLGPVRAQETPSFRQGMDAAESLVHRTRVAAMRRINVRCPW